MAMYILMSCMMGFSGNKLFNRKDKSTVTSIKWACIAASAAILLRVVAIKLR